MLKALIVGADSVAPDIVLRNLDKFPNLKRMMQQGAMSSYAAYAQKAYVGSYSSEQNWSSIYTGLPPKEHNITTNSARGEKRRPQMKDYKDLLPFWEVLNQHGYRVGLWAADNCAEPVPIDGYVVSCVYDMISTPVECREAPRTLQTWSGACGMDGWFDGPPPPRRYPLTLAQQGYSYQDLLRNEDLAAEAIGKYQFEDALPNFEEEMAYWFHAMRRAQRECPVDVLYLFTPTTDLVAHCGLCSDACPVLVETYRILDRYIGMMMEEFSPEATVFLSDHGQQNFKDLIPATDPQIQREAFSARDEVLWLKNGYIAFEAFNGALLFSAHSLKGLFVAAGPGIRQGSVAREMRTLDIYPTLLELLDIEVPAGRSGYVSDIFEKELSNPARVLRPEQQEFSSIALIQSHAVSMMDIIINELYLENRFARLTVVGEERYAEIFLNNPRVTAFLPYEDFNADAFDRVYCGLYNSDTGLKRHIQIFSQ